VPAGDSSSGPTGRRAQRAIRTRALAAAALVLGVVALVLILTGGGEQLKLHLRLQNASQLVKGDLVEVGGVRVGSINKIELTSDNEADLSVTIDDASLLPLHAGTHAFVRSPSLSGVANRYIVLEPGPNSAPELRNGNIIPTVNTQAEVDLDAVQSSLDADTRKQLQNLIHGASAAYEGGGSKGLSDTLHYFAPGLTQLDATLGELVADRGALQRFIVASSNVVSAVADRQNDLEQGLASAATTTGALAGQSRALTRTLHAAPGALSHAGRTLTSLASTLDVVTPTAREARPTARRLSKVLTAAAPTLTRGAKVLPRFRAILEPLRAVLVRLPALRNSANPALNAATKAIVASLPIIEGTLPYVPDAIIGATNGFGGTAAGYYDANGEYARIAAVAGSFSNAGLLSTLPGPSLNATFGNTQRCPGAATQVTHDGSNKFDAGVPCKESQRP
jgi:phospholipid/cholesterol/gamma-HCH transport system substrate-binding protein